MWVELIPFYKELVVSGTHPFLQRTRLFKWSCTCFYFMKTVVRNSKSKGTNAKENMVLVQQTSNCKTKEAPNFILQWPTQQSMRSTKIQQIIKEFSKKPLPNYNSKHLYKFLNHSNKSSNPDPAHQQDGLPTITPQPLLREWNIKRINERSSCVKVLTTRLPKFKLNSSLQETRISWSA